MIEYYMAYEDWDRESHYPCGIFTDLRILKNEIECKYQNYEDIQVYKIILDEHFDFCDLKQIKFWWKKID